MALKNTKVSGTHWVVENREGQHVLVMRMWSGSTEAKNEFGIASHNPTAKEIQEARTAITKQLVNA